MTIGIPSADVLHADFCMSLAMLMRSSADLQVLLVNAKNSNLPEGRNQIVETALGHGSRWLLFLDSDMVFPADTIATLMAHGKPIVGATYCRRIPPFDLIGEPVAEPGSGNLREMARMPTGCLLIRTDVFGQLPRPWFAFGHMADGRSLGEDFLFCDRVRALGWSVWCDQALSARVAHVGQIVVTTHTASTLAAAARIVGTGTQAGTE